METENLIVEIENFAASMNLAPATVTSRAVGNSRLYHRLKSGKGCTLKVAERLRDFMSDQVSDTAAPEKPSEDAA